MFDFVGEFWQPILDFVELSPYMLFQQFIISMSLIQLFHKDFPYVCSNWSFTHYSLGKGGVCSWK